MYFFFSSRRRHTRYWRDWSSDVCSSDLWCHLFYSQGQRYVCSHPYSHRRNGAHLLLCNHQPFSQASLSSVSLSLFRQARSEEHTSELQSRQYLVCRLLLEKKKNTKSNTS